jgi:membrane protein YqaA with SNARE-associated domain
MVTGQHKGWTYLTQSIQACPILPGEVKHKDHERSRMFKRLYDFLLHQSARPKAAYALGAVSFSESSFFPLPPDVMLVPMALAKPEKAYFYAGLCTVTSVLGGLLGYAIGALLFDSVGAWLFSVYGLTNKAEAFREAYAQYGHWIILLKGFTPIPFKLVTITSGFAGYDLVWFTLLSLVTRGGRFFLLAALLGRYGAVIRRVMDTHFKPIMIGLVVIIMLGFLSFKFL